MKRARAHGRPSSKRLGTLPRGRRNARAGLSLLEAILAIAILGGAIALIGESIRLGTMAATDAQEYSMAQILAEGKLAELTTGMQMLTPTGRTPLEISPDWLYTIDVQPVDQQGLLAVAVTIERDPQYNARPVQVTLYRWMIDPQLIAEIQAQEAALAEEAAAASESASSTPAGGAAPGGGAAGTGGGMGNG